MSIQKSLLALAAALALSSAPAAAQGRWLASYPEVQNPALVPMQQRSEQQNSLASVIRPLREHFLIPQDVTLELAECGRAGAFYDPARQTVQLCYELVIELADKLVDEGTDDTRLFGGAFTFVLLHQVGHALIDVLDLRVPVPPEEAADEFVALMVGFAGEDLAGMVEGAAALHLLGMNWENPGSSRAAVTRERLTQLACFVYGSNAEGSENLVDGDVLTAGRAAECPDEYAEMSEVWMATLEQHLQG
jgi:hypothetical protein